MVKNGGMGRRNVREWRGRWEKEEARRIRGKRQSEKRGGENCDKERGRRS